MGVIDRCTCVSDAYCLWSVVNVATLAFEAASRYQEVRY